MGSLINATPSDRLLRIKNKTKQKTALLKWVRPMCQITITLQILLWTVIKNLSKKKGEAIY